MYDAWQSPSHDEPRTKSHDFQFVSVHEAFVDNRKTKDKNRLWKRRKATELTARVCTRLYLSHMSLCVCNIVLTFRSAPSAVLIWWLGVIPEFVYFFIQLPVCHACSWMRVCVFVWLCEWVHEGVFSKSLVPAPSGSIIDFYPAEWDGSPHTKTHTGLFLCPLVDLGLTSLHFLVIL